MALKPSKILYLVVAASLIIGTTGVKANNSTSPHGQPKEPFSWSKLRPSENLSWVDCDTGYQCARLQVPLNYSDPQGEQAAIALIRWPSSIPPDSPSYRGPILFNPGGPGGSGVALVRGVGPELSLLVGPEFDVVSFDPRGVGFSTPSVSFFESWAERQQWYIGNVWEINATADGIPRALAHAQITNKLAKQRDRNVLAHINTDNTARDMLRIVQAYGQEKLQYWGFSYGTVLGATFATLFPDKVGRMVLDGVVDAEDYYNGLWKANLQTTDLATQIFYDSCFDAGPDKCAFYADSPAAIAKNLQSLYDAVHARPVPVWTETYYYIVDYSALRYSIFNALYTPYFGTFPTLAQGLADLAVGNGTTLISVFGDLLRSYDWTCSLDEDTLPTIPESQSTILCNDGVKIPNTLEDTVSYLEDLKGVSEWWDLWGSIRTSCSGWPDLPKTHFRGPVQGNTSFPILFVGNAADPVTPLASAHKISLNFPGSIVLSQNSSGHTSLAAPAPCTDQYIRNYFANGTLPDEGTWCPVLGTPFSDESELGKRNGEDIDLDLENDNESDGSPRFGRVAKRLRDASFSPFRRGRSSL